MIKKILLLILLLIPLASAYNINYNIESNNVLTTIKLNTEGFRYQLPIDAKAVSIKQNSQIIEPNIQNNILTIPKGDIEFSYISKSQLEKGKNYYFIEEFTPIKQEQSTITLTLPDKAYIEDNPIFPKQTKLQTDGKQITIVWEKYLKENFSIFVTYKQSRTYTWLVIPLAIIILILICFLRKKPKIVEKTKVIRKKIDQHLTKEEKKVVDALKKKNNQCEQATLRIITDFSKASLSRLLTDMEKRKLIKKIKKGKKNIVKLI